MWDLLPGIYKQLDPQYGNVLQTWTESLRYSFDLLTNLIQNWSDLRDPLKVRTAYDQVTTITLGPVVTPPVPIEQRGTDGAIVVITQPLGVGKVFTSPTARFKQSDTGKKLTLFNSSIPVNNRSYVVARIINTTQIWCDPPLVVDPGPIRWQLEAFSVLPPGVMAVQVQAGDVSEVVPSWVLFDGFSEFQVYSRNQFFPTAGQSKILTVLDGKSGQALEDGTFLAEVPLAQTNVGQPFSVSGSTVTVPNSSFTNNGKYQIYYVNPDNPANLTFHAPLTIQGSLISGVLDPNSAVIYTMTVAHTGAQVAHLVYGPSSSLFVIVSGNQISVYLATDSNSVPTSSAADVAAAIKASEAASALVTAVYGGTGSSLAAVSAFQTIPGTRLVADGGPLTWSLLPFPQLQIVANLPPAGTVLRSGVDLVLTGYSAYSTTAKWTSSDVGKLINVLGSTIGNDQTYTITSVVGNSEVEITPAAWLAGSTASVTSVSSPSAVISGLSGVTPQLVGFTLNVLQAAESGNVGSFLITAYYSATSIGITNASAAVEEDSDLVWQIVPPSGTSAVFSVVAGSTVKVTGLSGIEPSMVGLYLNLSGASSAGNNGSFQIVSFSSSSVVWVSNSNATAPDAASSWSVVDGGLTWAERALTGIGQGGSVQVYASSLLDFLAQDFGITIDDYESEARQRSWVANMTQWIGLKGTAAGYETIGSISGFNVTPSALYRVSQTVAYPGLPSTSIYLVDETGSGRYGTDGKLTASGGYAVFTSKTAVFSDADVGLCIQIGNSASNSALFTIYEYLSPTSVQFAVYNTATNLPDYGMDGTELAPHLEWDVCRIYTTQAPTRPLYDEVYTERMQEIVGPSFFLPDSYCWESDLTNSFPVNITAASPLNSNGVPIYFDVVAEGVPVTTSDSGTSASVSSVASSLATITGLFCMSSALEGRTLTLSGAASAGNNGTFEILSCPSATAAVVSNSNASAGDSHNGSIVWKVSGKASIVAAPGASAGVVAVTGLTNMAPWMAGRHLTLSGAASSTNNGSFLIGKYISPSEVYILNLHAVEPDANNGAISWSFGSLGVYSSMEVIQDTGPWSVTDSAGNLFYVEPLEFPFQRVTIGTGNSAVTFMSLIQTMTSISITISYGLFPFVSHLHQQISIIAKYGVTTAADVASMVNSDPEVGSVVYATAGGDGSGLVANTISLLNSRAYMQLQGGVVPVIGSDPDSISPIAPPSTPFGTPPPFPDTPQPPVHVFRTFSSEVPVVGPATVTYSCPVVPSCGYCAASAVVLNITEGTIVDESGPTIVNVLDRLIYRIQNEVTPIHVRLLPVFSRTLFADWTS